MPEPQPLKTARYLELSFKYITGQDFDLLVEQAKLTQNNQPCCVICHLYEYGFLIPVFGDFWGKRVARLREAGFSDDFIFGIYERCIAEGIRMIDMFQLGPEQPLPEHGWVERIMPIVKRLESGG